MIAFLRSQKLPLQVELHEPVFGIYITTDTLIVIAAFN
jgi:hypothetical protein